MKRTLSFLLSLLLLCALALPALADDVQLVRNDDYGFTIPLPAGFLVLTGMQADDPRLAQEGIAPFMLAYIIQGADCYALSTDRKWDFFVRCQKGNYSDLAAMDDDTLTQMVNHAVNAYEGTEAKLSEIAVCDFPNARFLKIDLDYEGEQRIPEYQTTYTTTRRGLYFYVSAHGYYPEVREAFQQELMDIIHGITFDP